MITSTNSLPFMLQTLTKLQVSLQSCNVDAEGVQYFAALADATHLQVSSQSVCFGCCLSTASWMLYTYRT